HLDFCALVGLEEFGIRLLDSSAAKECSAARLARLAVFRPHGGDGLGIALVEGLGEVAGRFYDRLTIDAVRSRRRRLGDVRPGGSLSPNAVGKRDRRPGQDGEYDEVTFHDVSPGSVGTDARS